MLGENPTEMPKDFQSLSDLLPLSRTDFDIERKPRPWCDHRCRDHPPQQHAEDDRHEAALNIAFDQTEARGYVGFDPKALLWVVVIICSAPVDPMIVADLPALLGSGSRTSARWISAAGE
jgi:hypothetical protein